MHNTFASFCLELKLNRNSYLLNVMNSSNDSLGFSTDIYFCGLFSLCISQSHVQYDQLSWQQHDEPAPQSEYEQESIATEPFHRDVDATFPTHPMTYVTMISLSRRDSSASRRRWSHPSTEQFVRAYLRGSSTKRDVVLPLTMGSLQVSGTMESSTA